MIPGLAKELRPHNVAVIGLMPGFVGTERMARRARASSASTPRRPCRSRTPAASAPCSRPRDDPMFFSGRDVHGPTFHAEHALMRFDVSRQRGVEYPRVRPPMTPHHGGTRGGREPGRDRTEPRLRAGWSTTGAIILAQGNLPQGRAIDRVSRWLLITRACVFSMTITSALIGGLLAAATRRTPHWGFFALALLGLVRRARRQQHDQRLLRHRPAASTPSEYTRALYAPHPLLSGLISQARAASRRSRVATSSTSRSCSRSRRRAAGRSWRSRSPGSSSASSTWRRRSS